MWLPPPDREHDSPEAGSPASLPLLVIGASCIAAAKGNAMPRQKRLLTVIRELVQQEVRSAVQSLFGNLFTATPAKNGRRRRKRRRGPGRPKGSKNKAA
jgi:hypothetical protein